MFSKEDSTRLRQEFWTSFGKSFPRKWILYNTQIKGFSFKFQADTKKAMVCLDIESADEIKNELLYDQLNSLQAILKSEYLPDVIYNPNYVLENNKEIYRIYVSLDSDFSIHNKQTWGSAFIFFKENMSKFEQFYVTYEEFIKQSIT